MCQGNRGEVSVRAYHVPRLYLDGVGSAYPPVAVLSASRGIGTPDLGHVPPDVRNRAPARGENWIPPLGPERPDGLLEPPAFEEPDPFGDDLLVGTVAPHH